MNENISFESCRPARDARQPHERFAGLADASHRSGRSLAGRQRKSHRALQHLQGGLQSLHKRSLTHYLNYISYLYKYITYIYKIIYYY